MKKRILYVITSSGVGGAEKTLFNLLSRLNRDKYDIAGVVTLKPRGEYAGKIAALGIPIHSLNMGYLPSPGDAARLRRIIKESGAETVHAFLYRAIQFCRHIKPNSGFRLVSSPRVNYRTRALPLLWLDRALKHRDDLTLCESAASAEFLISGLGYDSGKVRVVKNGIDTELWAFSEKERAAVRAQFGLNEGRLLIFSNGRLDRQKGFEHLLRAFPAVAEKHPNALLAIAGRGPLEHKLRQIALETGQADRVLFLGQRSDIRELLCACDIFALPSLWEGLPNSLLEAMSVGRACAASAVDGTRELLEDGVSGLLTEAANSHSIAQALLRLARDEGLRSRLGGQARLHATREHAFAAMIAGHEAAYEACLYTENAR
ncbi:MAG: glycosyltransferase [Elusimicrobia bacterium]|nr:glycosyltransferase [Elusimicrobiota bacterium]